MQFFGFAVLLICFGYLSVVDSFHHLYTNVRISSKAIVDLHCVRPRDSAFRKHSLLRCMGNSDVSSRAPQNPTSNQVEKIASSFSRRIAPLRTLLQKPLLVVIMAASGLLCYGKAAVAAISNPASKGTIKGWDLFGRVPNDDWLFSTGRLVNPNLLKRSFPEAVSSVHCYCTL